MMCPRNCGPVTRQPRRVGSLCICHNPLRVETSSVTRRSRALFVDFILPLLILFVPGGRLQKLRFRGEVDKTATERSQRRRTYVPERISVYNISSRGR